MAYMEVVYIIFQQLISDSPNDIVRTTSRQPFNIYKDYLQIGPKEL